MRFWTWDEIKTKVENEIDLQDETFVRSDELMEYVNEAIDEAESEIHTLYEDYFLTYADTAVAASAELMDLPSDIYALKIRKVFFYTGSVGSSNQFYRVKRLSDNKKLEEKALNDAVPQLENNYLQYFPVNLTAGNPQIMFTPLVQTAGVVRMWYLRNANRITTNADICDIPEFINFIFAHMKVKIFEKEGHPGLPDAQNKLESERQRMISTLQSMVPDGDNEIEADYSHYEEMT